MPEALLTPERILVAAEDVLRRYGPAKATVVDVARVLGGIDGVSIGEIAALAGVSQGALYRHFPSKSTLREAVTERWLARISGPLGAIAAENAPALDRLRRWLELLISSKRSRALEDPELFATYMELVGESREVVLAHVSILTEQLASIIGDGIHSGGFAPTVIVIVWP